jgi:hypothetical protein
MANLLYDLGRQKFLNGEIDWTDDTIKLLLVDTGNYTVNIATHEFHSDITAAGIEATSGAFGSKSSAAGVAGAANVVLSSVSASADECEAIIIYKEGGSSGTSPLIAYIDTATGLPVTPNGADITIEWDTGSDLIFKL